MLKVRREGGSFSHAHSSTLWKKPETLEYDNTSYDSIEIDQALGFNGRAGKRYGWIHESKSIIPNVYEIAKSETIRKLYCKIFTHDEELLALDPVFKFSPAMGYWIEDPHVRNKSKICSFISSNKVMCAGHRHRLGWVQKLWGKVDLFGRGFKEIKKKEEGLDDYMFSVAIENGKYDTYFTEKILDCFATGTIPIYYGTDKIVDYFDKDGIIFLTDEFDVTQLNQELYQSKLNAVHTNADLVMDFNTVEDWLVRRGYFE